MSTYSVMRTESELGINGEEIPGMPLEVPPSYLLALLGGYQHYINEGLMTPAERDVAIVDYVLLDGRWEPLPSVPSQEREGTDKSN